VRRDVPGDRDRDVSEVEKIREREGECMSVILRCGVLVVVSVLILTSPAFASRWKRFSGIAPTGAVVRGSCYWANETGTNECRWKIDNGCKWVAESGTDQCDPNAPTGTTTTTTTTTTPPPTETTTAPVDPWAPVTFSASNGWFTVTPIDDGDGNPDTMAGIVKAKRNATAEVITFKVRIRVTQTDPVSVAHLSSAATALQTSPVPILFGDATYPPIYRTPTGWSGSSAGYTCSVSWSNFVAAQFNCFNNYAGKAFATGLRDATNVGYHMLLPCFRIGRTLATYTTCVAAAAGSAFVYGMIDDLFGRGTPAPGICNTMDQTRFIMSELCTPYFP